MKKLIFALSLVTSLNSFIPIYASEINSSEINNSVNSEFVTENIGVTEDQPILLEGDSTSSMGIAPRYGAVTQYSVKNKTYTGTVDIITKYISTFWSKASSYTVNKGESNTASLQITGSGEFKNGIKAGGAFTLSRTWTSSLSTNIPVTYPTRNSKLVLKTRYNVYKADLYSRMVTDSNPNPPYVFYERGTVSEPTGDTYAVVIYQ